MMPDYNKLTKEQLVLLLDKKDLEVTSANDKVKAYQKTVNSQASGINQLKEQLAKSGAENNAAAIEADSAEALITAILQLPEVEKQLLPVLTRTTTIGIQAFTTFVYGAASSLNDGIPQQPDNGGIQQPEGKLAS